MNTPIEKAAAEALALFSSKKRDTGESFYFTEAPTGHWLNDLVQAAHNDGEMLPDDMRYDMIHTAIYALANDGADPDEMHETADSMVSVYTHDRQRWLSSHGLRAGYVDEATEQFGPAADLDSSLGQGWYMEAIEICGSVVDSLRARADEIEAEEAEAEEEAERIDAGEEKAENATA